MSAEEWRPVVGNPYYRISSLGRVISTAPREGNRNRTPRILKPGYTTGGYPTVVLAHPDEPRRTRYIHHLVAEAFIGPRPDGLEIRHWDGDPANAQADNLLYGSTSDNAYDRVRHGTHVNARKTRCKRGHPFDEINTYMPRDGHRECRTCRRAKSRNYRARRALRAANVPLIEESAA